MVYCIILFIYDSESEIIIVDEKERHETFRVSIPLSPRVAYILHMLWEESLTLT